MKPQTWFCYSKNNTKPMWFPILVDMYKLCTFIYEKFFWLRPEESIHRIFWGKVSWLCVMFSSVFSRMQEEKGSKTLMAAWPFELFVSGCRCPMTRKDLAWDIISWIPAIIAYFCSSLSCIHVDEADRQILMHTRI